MDRKSTVEGSLHFTEQESSEEESDDEVEIFTSTISSDQIEKSTIDEQIELFNVKNFNNDKFITENFDDKSKSEIMVNKNTDTVIQTSSNVKNDLNNSQKTPKNLIDLMAASVSFVEQQNASKKDLAKLDQASSNSFDHFQNNEKGDLFGIPYKPYKKKSEEPNIPKGPAFKDEAEFEKDLKSNNIVIVSQSLKEKAIDEDDEFDVLVPEGSEKGGSGLLDALQRVASSSDVEVDNYPPPAPQPPAACAVAEDPPASSYNLRQAAAAALEGVRGVYMGVTVSADPPLLPADPLPRCIPEADEDAELREEQLEQQAKEQAAAEERDWALLAAQGDALAPFSPRAAAAGVSSWFDAALEERPALVDADRCGYDQALRYLSAQNLGRFLLLIQVRDPPAGGLLKMLSQPPALKIQDAEAQLRLPFLLAQLDYDPADPLHLRSLQSIYLQLVGGAAGPPALGSHWEAAGFQGTDPRTDLNRSMKMLAVLQVLHLLERDAALAKLLFELASLTEPPAPDSNKGVRSPSEAKAGDRRMPVTDPSWPFMCVSLSLTVEALQLLRSGQLNRRINKEGSVMWVLHAMHHALFFDLAHRLVDHPATHHAYHLADLRKEAQKDPLLLLRSYRHRGAVEPQQQPDFEQEEEQEVIQQFADLELVQVQDPVQPAARRRWNPFGSSKADKFLV